MRANRQRASWLVLVGVVGVLAGVPAAQGANGDPLRIGTSGAVTATSPVGAGVSASGSTFGITASVTTAAGTGVYASNSQGGYGLQVNGKTGFSRSGVLTLGSSTSSIVNSGVPLTSSSHVFATLQTNASGLFMQSAVPDAGGNDLTILSGAAQGVTVGVPAQMSCGATETVTLQVRNQTRTAWPVSAPLTLHAGPAALALGSPAVVRRVGSGAVRRSGAASFAVHLTAPANASLLRPSWRLYRGKTTTPVVVGGPVQVFCDQGSGTRNKVLAGYQGWFSCPNDGAPPGHWIHWFDGEVPDAVHATFDVWPDTSELTASERCPTGMTLPGGAPAVLFSSANPATVERHVSWMRQYGIDGVFYQRFLSTLYDPALARNRDIVLLNLLRSAERDGRKVAVEWALTGDLTGSIREQIRADWRHLVDDLHVTSSPAYLYDHGRPLVGIFGFGFTYPTGPSDSAGGTPAGAMAVLDNFHHPSEPRLAARVMGGVPTYWRTLTNDSRSEPAWDGVYAAFDILEPWPVGRYVDDAGDNSFRSELVAPDLALTSSRGQDYMPGIFPGFSWHNLFRNRGEDFPLNQIPRRGGRFLWNQGWNLVDAGATSIFVAMFDEVDEGTAIFKAAPTQSRVPAQGTFLSLDADGENLPSDWYLRVTGEIGRMLRHETPARPELPITP